MALVLQTAINGIIAGSLYALIAMGFNLTFATTRFFNLAHGSMAVVGGYLFYALSHKLGLGILPAGLLGIASSGVVSVLVNRVVFSPLHKRHATNLVKLLASLGVMTIFQSLFAIIFGPQFQPLSRNDTLVRVMHVGTAAISMTQLWTLAWAIFCALILFLLLRFTLFGLAMRAISDDEEVSEIVGVNTSRITGFVFFMAGALSGLAGILFGLDTGIDPNIGMAVLLKGIIAAIIGGVGNVFGGFVGAFILGFVENFGVLHIAAQWKDAIAFCVLILFLIFRPEGIFKR